MLDSTLMSKAQTNRWFKPSSFVESYSQGVGRPWEIFRVKVNGQSVDLYTKAGDCTPALYAMMSDLELTKETGGAYATAFFLVPQYNFGFSVLTATDPGTSAGAEVRTDFPNKIVDIILPVLDEIAKDQAIDNFAGHYTSTDGNSSVSRNHARQTSQKLRRLSIGLSLNAAHAVVES